ncbi:MAG TPA: hypothetical protein VF797_08600 [Noviherbaspirillum sp.]
MLRAIYGTDQEIGRSCVDQSPLRFVHQSSLSASLNTDRGKSPSARYNSTNWIGTLPLALFSSRASMTIYLPVFLNIRKRQMERQFAE